MKEACHDHDYLHFFCLGKGIKRLKKSSSTPLLKEADFQLTLLPKLMRLVINWTKACALLIDSSGPFYLPHINNRIWSDASQTLCYSWCRSLLHRMLAVSPPAEQQHRRSSKHATHKEPYSISRKLWTFPYISTVVAQLDSGYSKVFVHSTFLCIWIHNNIESVYWQHLRYTFISTNLGIIWTLRNIKIDRIYFINILKHLEIA